MHNKDEYVFFMQFKDIIINKTKIFMQFKDDFRS